MLNKEPQLYKIRHSSAHIMAQAVLLFYPEAKLGIGAPIEDGFYYDFDLGMGDDGKAITFSPDDLPKIEARMREIIRERHWFEQFVYSAESLRQRFHDQPYKLELIDELAASGETLTTYRQADFEDLCRGPHVAHSQEIAANGFKLLQIVGAYWRGDENRPMLQRIYAMA